MWNKIFLGLLAIAILGMLGLTYFSYSWLQSLTKPADVAANYNFYTNLYWLTLWISSLVLLIVGNVILWTQRKSWALWLSFAYFAVFITIQMWWLGESFAQYQKQNGLGDGSTALGPIFGAIICVLVAVVVFFDQFLITRMRDKMHGTPQTTVEPLNENVRVSPPPDTEI